MIRFLDKKTYQFAGRVGVSIAVLGAVLMLSAVTLSTVQTFVGRANLQQADSGFRDQLNHIDSDDLDTTTSTEQKIARCDELIKHLKDKVSITAGQHHLAGLYHKLGMQYLRLASPNYTIAEQSFHKAGDLDSTNPLYVRDLAELYYTAAENQRAATMQDEQQKAKLLDNSSTYYQNAARMEPDPYNRRSYTRGAATSYVSLARSYHNMGEDPQARTKLDQAKLLIGTGDPLMGEIDELMTKLRG